MSATAAGRSVGEQLVLDVPGLAALLEQLRATGHQVVGPTVRDGAIVYGDIQKLEDLPRGWTDEQEAGHYRLRRRDDLAFFGYAVGPHSLKQFLFVPKLQLVQLRRSGRSFEDTARPRPPPRLAILGARACDLAAVFVQDRVFVDGPVVDADYVARRNEMFVIAVQCGVAAKTCFCVSMATGPRAKSGFDLALTELVGEQHRFVVEIGSERGAELISLLAASPSGPPAAAPRHDLLAAEAVVQRTAEQMGRSLDTTDIKDLLYRNLEHPRWDDVASRCLGCASCTLACPTCFCSTVEDATDLSGDVAERVRRWDSCFTLEHSHVHGGSVRTSLRSRYRQWLTHKLASWIDQFGTSGCVGCGRCVTWCPVGIDITAEIAAFRSTDGEVVR